MAVIGSIAQDSQGNALHFGDTVKVVLHNPFLEGDEAVVTGQSGGGWELYVQSTTCKTILLLPPGYLLLVNAVGCNI